MPSPTERAELLKERVYVSFTALAVVLTLSSHSGGESPGSAASTLFVTVLGTLLAVFVADVISHISVRGVVPTRHQFIHMLSTSFGSLATVVVPFLLVGLAGLGVISIAVALRLSSLTLLMSLLIVGLLAIRRTQLTLWQRVVVLGSETALGAAVVGLQLVAHA